MRNWSWSVKKKYRTVYVEVPKTAKAYLSQDDWISEEIIRRLNGYKTGNIRDTFYTLWFRKRVHVNKTWELLS